MFCCFRFQSQNAELGTRMADSSTRGASVSELYAHAGVHDIQYVAVCGRGARLGHWLLPLWLARVRSRGLY